MVHNPHVCVLVPRQLCCTGPGSRCTDMCYNVCSNADLCARLCLRRTRTTGGFLGFHFPHPVPSGPIHFPSGKPRDKARCTKRYSGSSKSWQPTGRPPLSGLILCNCRTAFFLKQEYPTQNNHGRTSSSCFTSLPVRNHPVYGLSSEKYVTKFGPSHQLD
jgi:hypothetical protein